MKRLIICCDGTWNKPDQMDRGVMRPTDIKAKNLPAYLKSPDHQIDFSEPV